MASRCMSAIDDVNNIALEIERRHRKGDAYYIAKETLARIKRERSLIDSCSSKSENRRTASLPSNSFKEKHELRRPSRDRYAKQSGRATPSSLSSSTRSQRVHYQPDAAPKNRPNTLPDYGKSYTNRCVKEIFNKLQHGAYASEWYKFSNTTLPSPKWINFNSGENGGALDAFLCKNDDDDGNKCYMMDVRIGEKVGRLLKYPGTIRVGQNGYIREQRQRKVTYDECMFGEVEAGEADDDSGSKAKPRPFPLSWSEQFDWKDVKVVTVAEKDKNHDEKKMQQTVDRDLSKSNTSRKRELRDFKTEVKSVHNYALEPIDLRVIQNLPRMKTRQKCIRGFYIADRSSNRACRDFAKRAANIDRKGIDSRSLEVGNGTSNTNHRCRKQKAPKRREFLSINLRPVTNRNDNETERWRENPLFAIKNRQDSGLDGNKWELDTIEDEDLREVNEKQSEDGQEAVWNQKRSRDDSVTENASDFNHNHTDLLGIDNDLNEKTANDPYNTEIIDSIVESNKKRVTLFFKASNNKQTFQENHELPTDSEAVVDGSYVQDETARDKENAVAEEQELTENSNSQPAELLENLRREIRESVENESSKLQEELHALQLKQS